MTSSEYGVVLEVLAERTLLGNKEYLVHWACSIYRHSGPSSPRLGGGGLSKLITNSYCSYVT